MEYMTLREASMVLGYRDASTLRHATQAGKAKTLKTEVIEGEHRTTMPWIEDWQRTLSKRGYPRGKPRKRTTNDSQASTH